ncbi:MAG: hypothetical protein ACXADL_06990 [Candidatus Thorarchaeota archaeon]|jgi:hypothetical protein
MKSLYSLTDDTIESWIDSYNRGQHSFDSPSLLTKRVLLKLLTDKYIDAEHTLIEFIGPRPAAVGRLITKDAESRTEISDLRIISNRTSAGSDLIEYSMKQSRVYGSEVISAWVPEKASNLSDILTTFTFDLRQIRVVMINKLMSKQKSKFEGNIDTTVLEKPHSSAFRSGFPVLLPRVDGDSIQGLLDSMSNKWYPGFQLTDDADGGSSWICYLSNTKRQVAWLLCENTSLNRVVSETMLAEALSLLYDSGVRAVYSEIEPSSTQKDRFVQSGFVSKEIFLQFELPLL